MPTPDLHQLQGLVPGEQEQLARGQVPDRLRRQLILGRALQAGLGQYHLWLAALLLAALTVVFPAQTVPLGTVALFLLLVPPLHGLQAARWVARRSHRVERYVGPVTLEPQGPEEDADLLLTWPGGEPVLVSRDLGQLLQAQPRCQVYFCPPEGPGPGLFLAVFPEP